MEQGQEMPLSPDHIAARKNFIEKEKNVLIKNGWDEEEALAEAEAKWAEGKEKNIKQEYVEEPETGEIMRKKTFEEIEKEKKEKGTGKERPADMN